MTFEPARQVDVSLIYTGTDLKPRPPPNKSKGKAEISQIHFLSGDRRKRTTEPDEE